MWMLLNKLITHYTCGHLIVNGCFVCYNGGMKHILQSKVINRYRRKHRWYNVSKGHTGTDHDYTYESLPSPVTGYVVKIAPRQLEMGRCIYLLHASTGDIWVFAHMKSNRVKVNDHVKRGELLGITGNTGIRSSRPHLHLEVITRRPVNLEDNIMWRKLWNFKGYNTNPVKRLKFLYKKYNISYDGVQKGIPEPTWLKSPIKKIKKIPYPDWLRTKK